MSDKVQVMVMSEKPSYEKLEKRIRELEQAESERKRAEKKLIAREKRYRKIFENLQDVYYEADIDGTVLEVSPSIEKISQYKREELIGKSLYDIYTNPEEREEFKRLILEKGQVNDYEIHLRDKDGSQHPCSITTLLTQNDRGTPVKLIGSLRDISQRTQGETLLRQSEERFRLVFHTSPDAINLNRVSDGMYIDINAGFTSLTGYSREDVIGKTSLALNIWENPQGQRTIGRWLMKTGHVKNLEARFVRKNGDVGTGLMSARILQINDENVILSITRDITERKLADEALRRSEERFRTLVEESPLGVSLIAKAAVTICQSPL